MSCSLVGDQHCALSCGSQAASNTAPVSAGDAPSPKLQQTEQTPTVVVWEATQACDMKCVQCRVNSRPHRHPLELSTAEAFHLIDQVAKMKVPLFALTGGDPLKRADLLPIVQYATRNGVPSALTASTTPLLVRQTVVDLKQSGLGRMAIGLDGSTPQLHDSFRGAQGSYKRTLDGIGWCQETNLPVQINTTLTRRNLDDLDALIELLVEKKIAFWNISFLVPTARIQVAELLTADQHEAAFAKLYETSKRVNFEIKTTEGQHYARFVAQQKSKGTKATAKDLYDGKGLVFVSHTGEVYPSGFLPLPAGNILWEPLAEIYQYSPVFRSLRDSCQLKGKCGRCEFKDVCGGSRARAYAMTNDPLAEEPRCAYTPA
ncbi:MAG TPA: radical SAM protein [Terriglobales bacterium]|nr:radical SAM protein [Terriglobales bacterium]